MGSVSAKKSFLRSILLFMATLVSAVLLPASALAAAPADVIYGTYNQADYNYFHYSATGTTQYDNTKLGGYGIISSSQDKQWVLTSQWGGLTASYPEQQEFVALSPTGQAISFGHYYDQASMPESCTTSSRFFTNGEAYLAKANGTPKKLYFLGITAPCGGGNVLYTKATFRIYSVGVNGASRKAISPKLSAMEGPYQLLSVASNGYVLFTTGKRPYVVSSTGKTILKGSTSIAYIYLSGNGKKIAYEKHGSTNAIYLADANGKHSKKVTSLKGWNKDQTKLLGISETGKYVLFEQFVNVNGTDNNIGIYAYYSGTKKTVMIDSGFSTFHGFDFVANDKIMWVASTSTAIYAAHDAVQNTSTITQIGANGTGKLTLVTDTYNPYLGMDLY